MYGGSKVRLLNCEYGARLGVPVGDKVEIQPMGRGTTHAWKAVRVDHRGEDARTCLEWITRKTMVRLSWFVEHSNEQS
jgi:hypothetical protein